MTIRARLAAFVAALGSAAPAEPVLALDDADAITLAGEVDSAALRFPAEVAAAVAALEEVGPAPTAGNAADLVAWAKAYDAAAAAFWDVFEGQTVDGVRVIRRRGA